MKTVLIIEYDSDLKEALKIKLVEDNFDVLTAEDGEEALSIVSKKSGINVILFDLAMPQMDGQTFIHFLTEKLKKDIPLIVLTTLESAAYQVGVSSYLIKSQTDVPQIVEEIKKYSI